MWSRYAILVVQLIKLASWWSVKLWSCSAGGVLQMIAFQSLAEPHLHAWNNGDCRILKLDCNVWIPKLLILSRYPGPLDYHKIKKWWLAKLREIHLKWQQASTKHDAKQKKIVESHQDTGPCPPYSAFPQVTTRASPRSTAKAPADAWIWRTSTSCLATLLQSLGEENPEDLVQTSCKFQEILHKLLKCAMKRHLVMCQLTWKLGALGSLSWRTFSAQSSTATSQKKVFCSGHKIFQKTNPSLSTIVSVPPSFDSSILPQRCKSMWWWLDGNDWMVGIGQLIGHIFGHRWMTPTNDTTILLQRGKATAGRFDRNHFTDLVLSKRGFMWCRATRVGRCARIDLPKTKMCFLESKFFSRTPTFSHGKNFWPYNARWEKKTVKQQQGSKLQLQLLNLSTVATKMWRSPSYQATIRKDSCIGTLRGCHVPVAEMELKRKWRERH